MSEFVSMRPFQIRSSKNDYEKRVDITSKRRFFMLLVPISWALAICNYGTLAYINVCSRCRHIGNYGTLAYIDMCSNRLHIICNYGTLAYINMCSSGLHIGKYGTIAYINMCSSRLHNR